MQTASQCLDGKNGKEVGEREERSINAFVTDQKQATPPGLRERMAQLRVGLCIQSGRDVWEN